MKLNEKQKQERKRKQSDSDRSSILKNKTPSSTEKKIQRDRLFSTDQQQKSVPSKLPERIQRLFIAKRESGYDYFKEITQDDIASEDTTPEDTTPEDIFSRHQKLVQNMVEGRKKSNDREKKELKDRILQIKRNLQYAMDDSAMKLAKLESLLHSQHQEAGAKQVSWIQKIEELKCHNQRLEEGLQQHEKESKGIQEDGDRKILTIRKLDEQRLVKEQMCKLETNNKVLRQKLSVTEHTVNQLKSHTKELKEFYEQETAQLHARIRKLEGKTASSGDLIYTVEELIAMTENLKEDKKALTLKISKLESRQRTLEDSLLLSQKNEEYFEKSLKRTLGEIANIEKALKRLNELLRENQ